MERQAQISQRFGIDWVGMRVHAAPLVDVVKPARKALFLDRSKTLRKDVPSALKDELQFPEEQLGPDLVVTERD